MGHDDLPALELAFPGPERNRGVATILSGHKTALTGLHELYEHAGEAVPRAEGRGYADAAGGRAGPGEVFQSDGVSELLGRTPVIDDDMLVVAERFRVVERESWPHRTAQVPGWPVAERVVEDCR